MLLSFKKNWTDWFSIFISALCYWLGNLHKEENKDERPILFQWLDLDYYNLFVENRGYALLVIIVLLVILQLYITKRKSGFQKLWLQEFLKHLTNQHLSGGNYNTRITIFRARKGWHFLMPHFFHWVITGGRHPFSALPNPFKNYLSIYVRHCSSEQSTSFTFFRINKDMEKKSSSSVAECYRTNKKISIKTDSISDIVLPKEINSLNRNEKKRVQKYMNESGISDYDTLLTIHVRSNSLLALPIQHNNIRWGVIVFDHLSSDTEPIIDFNEKINDDFLGNYQKIVQFTTQLIM